VTYCIYTPRGIPAKYPKYLSRVLRDEEDGRVYASPCLVRKDAPEQLFLMALVYDGAPYIFHEGHLYAPVDWLRAEYPDLTDLHALLDKMQGVVERTVARERELAAQSGHAGP
jgi:hypothetical protein